MTVLKFDDGTNEISLLGSVARLIGSYSMQGRDEDRVTEVFEIEVTGADIGTVRTNAQSLSDVLVRAREWVQDTLRDTSVYLIWNTTGENEKRSLVYDFEMVPIERGGLQPYTLTNNVGYWRLSVTRSYYWELTSATQSTSTTNFDTLGGKFDASGDISGGDFDSRITSLLLPTTGTTGDQTELWVGLRPLREGINAYNPVFECESNYTLFSADSTSATDASASGGSVINVDFDSTATMYLRFYNDLAAEAGGAANLQYYIGRYHFLLRAKVDTGTAAVRFVKSFATPTTTNPQERGPIVYISDTSYHIYDLGVISLPIELHRSGIAGQFSQIYLGIMAEEVDGAPSLDCDAYILLPAEYSVYLENIESLGSSNRLDLRTTEDGKLMPIVEDSSNNGLTVPSAADTGAFPWAYPREGGVIVVAGQRSAGSSLTDEFGGYTLTVNKRWLNYTV